MRGIGRISVAMISLMVFATGVQAQSLNCTITNYATTPYTQATLVGLLPEHQHHSLKDGVARFGDLVGSVTQDDSSRLKWKYNLSIEEQSGMPATLSYTVIRNSKLLIVRVELGGSRQIGPQTTVSQFSFAYTIDSTGEIEFMPVLRVAGHCVW